MTVAKVSAHWHSCWDQNPESFTEPSCHFLEDGMFGHQGSEALHGVFMRALGTAEGEAERRPD